MKILITYLELGSPDNYSGLVFIPMGQSTDFESPVNIELRNASFSAVVGNWGLCVSLSQVIDRNISLFVQYKDPEKSPTKRLPIFYQFHQRCTLYGSYPSQQKGFAIAPQIKALQNEKN